MSETVDLAVDKQFEQLRTRLAQISDLNAAAAVLSWDQETYMPPGASAARAAQIATVQTLAHTLFTSDEIGELLDDLAPQADELPSDGFDSDTINAALVRVVKRDFDKARRLPTHLITRLAEAVSLAKEAWRAARESSDFTDFEPHLQRLIDLNIEKAEAYGHDDRIYDALLDDYEPGMNTALVEKTFGELRLELVPIVAAITEGPEIDDRVLHQRFDKQLQWDFGIEVISDFGYDFTRGRQDFSTHPFTTSFSITDVRITTRVAESFLSPALFGTLHEAGHALYEQGIDLALERTPLADGASLALHESQSRLWENLVGRSRPFWQHYYPRLQSVFPKQLGSVSLDAFYRAINRVHPGLIRVEADEVTYNLHIMLRFELENAILEGKVETRDLPELWNHKMHEYLGIRPDSDANGVLQDIHWSLGAFGYFPTYALGNLMSTQIFDQAARDLPRLEEDIAEGNFRELLTWLREHVHRYGRTLESTEILRRITGGELNASSWLSYVRRKYSQLYPGLAGAE